LELIWYLACLREAAPAEAGTWKLVLIATHLTQWASIDSLDY